MGRPLDGCLHKLLRAEQHLGTLDEQVLAFLEKEPKPYVLAPKNRADGNRRQNWIYLEVIEQPPPWIGVIVGDCIHNIRSALDYIAYELDRSLPRRQRNRGKTQFPIVSKDATEYRRNLHYVSSLPGSHRSVIRKLQPYQRWNEQPASTHPLTVLNSLSNRDKHRVIPVTVAQVNENSARISGSGIQAIHEIRHLVGPVTERKKEVLYVDYEVTDDPNPDVRLQGNLAIDVALPQGLPVRETILVLINEVRAIGGWFDAVLR